MTINTVDQKKKLGTTTNNKYTHVFDREYACDRSFYKFDCCCFFKEMTQKSEMTFKKIT